MNTKSIYQEAAKWFTVLQHAAPDDPRRTQFERWVMQSSMHAHAYQTVQKTWEDFDSTQKLSSLADAVFRKKLDDDQKRRKVQNAVVKMVVLLVVGFVGLFGWQQWQVQPLMQMAFSSSVGEIQRHTLQDNSQITLNADTNLEVIYYRNQRLVKLNRGSAIFEVSKNSSWPFVVVTKQARVTVLGTRFLVDLLEEKTRIAVDHGRVKVEVLDINGNAVLSPIELGDSQMTEVQLNTPLSMSNKNAKEAFVFASGMLSFEQATLTEVAQTLSRYRVQPVIAITNGKTQTISAMLKIQDIEQFITSLPAITQVEVKISNNQTQLISKK